MAGLDPTIHASGVDAATQRVDARVEPGHDDEGEC